jgi:hypothetical protein
MAPGAALSALAVTIVPPSSLSLVIRFSGYVGLPPSFRPALGPLGSFDRSLTERTTPPTAIATPTTKITNHNFRAGPIDSLKGITNLSRTLHPKDLRYN